MEKLNTLGIARDFLRRRVKAGDFCIDATAGRGRDTLFLAELVGETGKVFAFDIQKEAVESTRKRIAENKKEGIVTVFLDSHENLLSYAKEETVDAFTFNLGYLPGGDHRICTNFNTTAKALDAAMRLLKPHGVISLCIYYGGDSGYEEKNALMEYLKTVDSKVFTVLVADFYNRPNDPPLAVMILKET